MRRFILAAICCVALVAALGAEARAEVTLKMAGQYAVDHSITKLMMEFAKSVEERSGGEIKIRVFPANQLGDYTQIYEELRRGTIDLATISVPSQFDPRLEVIYLHYLAQDYNEVRSIYAPGSKMFNLVSEISDGLGIKFLGFNVEGFGGFAAVKKIDNLFDPKSPKNYLMRVPPLAVFQIACEDQGFQTVSIPFAELYTALQTGVADGWSGGTAVVNYVQFRDVIKYWIVNNNFVESNSTMMSKAAWDKLTPEHQKIVEEEGLKASLKSFDLAQENDTELLGMMEKAGIEVIRFDQAQLQAWADWCRETTWKKMEGRLTEEVIDSLLSDYK